MAYSSGIVLSMNEFYDSLISFMTGSGWSLYDNIPISGSRDKVLFSSGSSGKLNMYYRISTNQFGSPYKDPGDTHVKIPHVFIRGYHNWNATTHSGSGEHGEFGPLILAGEQWSSSNLVFMYPFERGDGTLAQPQNYTGYLLQTGRFDFVGYSTSLTGATLRIGGVLAYHDGRRRIWRGTSTGLICLDFVTGETRSFDAGAGTTNFHFNVPAVVKDPNTDREYIYCLAWNTTTFMRFDVENLSWGYVTSAPAANGGTQLTWDGGDNIYMHTNNNSTTFYKYTISSNTWTALAVSPVSFSVRAFNASHTPCHAVYVPASVTGLGEDVIYMMPTGGTTIYRYDVTSNAWRSTTGTGALTAQTTIAQTSLLYWDRKKYLYQQFASGPIYRSDLSVSPNSFSYLGALDTGARTHQGAIAMNFMTSKVRCNNVIPMKYFFRGDLDSLSVVCRIGSNPGSGRYNWAYMGQIDSSYRSDIMNVTSPVSPGVRVNVVVDSNSGFVSGDSVLFANWSGSHFERTSIFDMSGSTGFYCNLTSSFPAGTKVGIDPSQTILTGDTGIGTAAVSSAGYRADLESDWYYVWPESDYVAMQKNTPTARGAYLPARVKVYNNETFSVYATSTPGSRVNTKAETLGYLKNVYAIQQGSYPNPQNEDIINIGGAQYMFFNPHNNVLSPTNSDRRGILIGPIG